MKPSIGRKYQAKIPKLFPSLEERRDWPMEPILIKEFDFLTPKRATNAKNDDENIGETYSSHVDVTRRG